MRKVSPKRLAWGGALVVAAMSSTAAMATEGYYSNGTGARNKAVAGSGVADSRDATAITLNPAGLADLKESEIAIALSLFNPKRDVNVTGGPGFLPAGQTDSNVDIFPIPNFALAYRLNDNGVLGLSLSGNGGLNTNYSAVANPACASPPFPATDGVFCGGQSGVNLIQMFASVAYAHNFGPVRIGVSPIFAIQRFRGRGLLAFGGVTSDPTALSDNGQSYSTGFGGRFGIELEPTPGFRLGAAYQTKFNMSRFKEYAGLFADQGDFDIPSSYQLGVAADLTPKFTVMADYRRINYSDVGAVGNSSSIPLPFGSTGGPGFGWKDVEAYKIGAEYRPGPDTAVRLGFSHNTQPISGADVTLNVLAPGVVQDHFTAGASFGLNSRMTLELSGMYAPNQSVSGIEVTPMGPNPGRTITIEMSQLELTAGLKIKL